MNVGVARGVQARPSAAKKRSTKSHDIFDHLVHFTQGAQHMNASVARGVHRQDQVQQRRGVREVITSLINELNDAPCCWIESAWDEIPWKELRECMVCAPEANNLV
eukprot:1144949-Pelagomonas_calceolata.AAC.3